MTKGVLLFANNNEQVDYVKQAIFCAKRVKKYTNLNVTLVTDSSDALEQYKFYTKYIDNVVAVEKSTELQTRKFYDGDTYKDATWKNHSRASCFDISPYDQTLVIDTDFIVSSNNIERCFDSRYDFLINRYAYDLHTERDNIPELHVSNTSVPMYWATVFYFTKTQQNKMFFDLVEFIRDNWSYYKLLYNFNSKTYRNDFAFSIAIHILSNHTSIEQPKVIPTLYMITDRDSLLDIQDDKISVLLSNEGQDVAATLKHSDLHIMNKFSLDRYIDKDFANE